VPRCLPARKRPALKCFLGVQDIARKPRLCAAAAIDFTNRPKQPSGDNFPNVSFAAASAGSA
jgi:hypothetical protein